VYWLGCLSFVYIIHGIDLFASDIFNINAKKIKKDNKSIKRENKHNRALAQYALV